MKRLVLFFVFLSHCVYSYTQTDSLNCVKVKTTVKELVQSINQWNQTAIGMDYHLTYEKIDSILALNNNCFKKYELSQLYLDLAENIAKTVDFPEEKVANYFKKAILSGYSAAVILNLHTGLYVKSNFPDKYKELEHLSDSMYVVSCDNFKNASINLQLGFLLRYMIRKDQDVRTREMMARKKQKTKGILPKFLEEMNRVDSINEILLTEIFEQYGYPGWHLIGSEGGGSAITLLFHMSPKFKLNNIHLAIEANNKWHFADKSVVNGLIDRTLLQNNYKTSLYGSYNSKIEENQSVINKYRRLLQLPEEK